jgi:two-component system response regulator ResD
MNRVLLVEDDQKISEITNMYLAHQGFDVTAVYNAQSARKALEQSAFHVVIFDVMLPDGDGFQLLQQLRKGVYRLSEHSTASDIPALMLTALDRTENVVKGFGYGADDYMSKPFEPAELVARITAILKRTSKATPANSSSASFSSEEMQVGQLRIDLAARTIVSNGVELTLNRREYDLLLFLCRNIKKVYNREQLIALIWGEEFDGSDRSVDVCIQRVRSKLGKHQAGLEIKTIWGIGYMMEEVKS